MIRNGKWTGLICLVLSMPCLNAAAVKTWYFEHYPDPSGAYDLKGPTSPGTVSSWTICDTKSFSISPTDMDYWEESGGSGTGMNSSYSYGWGGTNTMVELIGSQTGTSATYRAIKCGATLLGGWAIDLDPNVTGSDNRRDFNFFGGNDNKNFDPAEVTIVTLGPAFSGHVTPTKALDASITPSCGQGDMGKTAIDFDKDSTSDFAFEAKTKADCKWYVQATTLRVRARAIVCTANLTTWRTAATSLTEWCYWSCVNQNYPDFYSNIDGNQSAACTQIHEDYHADQQLAAALAAPGIDPAIYITSSLPIVCGTRDSEAEAHAALLAAAKSNADVWFTAVEGIWNAMDECNAYNAEAACNQGLTHTWMGTSSGHTCSTCNATNYPYLTSTGC